jgi:predicted TPR repeat methyltransferase
VSSTSDYRRSHDSADKAERLDSAYRPGTFDAWIGRYERQLLQAIAAALATSAPVSLLDFACGTGRVVLDLAPAVADAVGVDISESMLEVARARGTDVDLICGDLTVDDELLPGPFRLITAFRFFLNAEPVLREEAMGALASRLSPDGLLVFNVHENSRSLRAARLWLDRARRAEGPSVLRDREARALVDRAGLRVVNRYGIGLVNRTLFRLGGEHLADAVEALTDRIPQVRALARDLVYVCARSSFE